MNSVTRLHAFVMDQAEAQPIERRAQIYRDLALIVSSAKEAHDLQKLADDCESIPQRHRQIAANLSARAARHP